MKPDYSGLIRSRLPAITAYGISPLLKLNALFVLLLISAPVSAVDCGSDGIIRLESQAEVDAFQETYGAGGTCDRIPGALVISGSDIESLTPLADVKSIADALNVRENAVLESLAGLANLSHVGYNSYDDTLWDCWSIWIRDNPSLLDIDDLSQLDQTTCDIRISNNPELRNLDGLSGMVSIGGSLEIDDNTALNNIDGLANVNEIGSGTVVSLLITDTQLENLDALDSLHHVDDLYIFNNPHLSDCKGILHLIDPVDDYEVGPGVGSVPDIAKVSTVQQLGLLENNAAGCNSVHEIAADEPVAKFNAGFMDSWFDPETNGQGVFISVFPEARNMFLSWFTYDLERPDESVASVIGEPGHRWMTAQGKYPFLNPETKRDENGTALFDLWVTAGGVFDASEPRPTWNSVGTVYLEVETCNKVFMSYDIPASNLNGTIPLQRLSLDNVWRCYELYKQRALPKTDD